MDKTVYHRFPMIDMEATGRNIKRLRRAAGFSVRDLQKIFGFSSPQAIYKWQRGEALPTLDNITVLARVLGVAIEDILLFDAAQGGRPERR